MESKSAGKNTPSKTLAGQEPNENSFSSQGKRKLRSWLAVGVFMISMAVPAFGNAIEKPVSKTKDGGCLATADNLERSSNGFTTKHKHF